jgi:hypothetical protein
MSEPVNIADCLNGLIGATADTEAQFHAAAGDVRSEEARTLLLDRARRFGCAAAALRALAAERGLVPVAPTAPGGATRIPPNDEAGILAECERREVGVILAYRDALECALPAGVHAVVAREFARLLASLGSLRAVRERAARQRRQVVGPVL